MKPKVPSSVKFAINLMSLTFAHANILNWFPTSTIGNRKPYDIIGGDGYSGNGSEDII